MAELRAGLLHMFAQVIGWEPGYEDGMIGYQVGRDIISISEHISHFEGVQNSGPWQSLMHGLFWHQHMLGTFFVKKRI